MPSASPPPNSAIRRAVRGSSENLKKIAAADPMNDGERCRRATGAPPRLRLAKGHAASAQRAAFLGGSPRLALAALFGEQVGAPAWPREVREPAIRTAEVG